MTEEPTPTLRLQHFDVRPTEYDGRRGLALTDHLGVAEPAFLPEGLLPIVGRLDGEHTIAAIEAELPGAPAGFVSRIVDQLDQRLLMFSPRYEAARDAAWSALTQEGVRPCRHAGSAGYPADPTALREALDGIVPSPTGAPASPRNPRPRGVVAPHIDLARGRDGYAQAYGYLAEAEPADLYVVFGTGHYGPSMPLTGMPLDWETPLGRARTDRAFVETVHEQLGTPSTEDLLLHNQEHSIEFQVLFLQHVLGDRPFEVACFMTGGLPSATGDPDREEYVVRLRRVLADLAAAARDRSVCWVAGADLAHLGPFFGDDEPIDDGVLQRLARDETERLAHLHAGAPGAFHRAVQANGNPDRVCGAAPIYLAAHLAGGAGELLHYGQAPAADGSQVVSFCSVGYGDAG